MHPGIEKGAKTAANLHPLLSHNTSEKDNQWSNNKAYDITFSVLFFYFNFTSIYPSFWLVSVGSGLGSPSSPPVCSLCICSPTLGHIALTAERNFSWASGGKKSSMDLSEMKNDAKYLKGAEN